MKIKTKEKKRQMGISKWVGLFLLLLPVWSLGCGEANEEVTELTLMHGWGGTLKTHNTMQEIYREFSVLNPDIKLKYIPYSDSVIAVQTANDMLSVGKMPDIISTNGLTYYVNNAVKTGMALDLMPYIRDDPDWKKQIHPAVFDVWETEGGELYTIPDAMETAGYWYNKKYLQSAGITDEKGAVTLPINWQDFFAMMDRLQEWKNQSDRKVAVCTLDPVQVYDFLFLARFAGESQEMLELAKNTSPTLTENILKPAIMDLQRMYRYSSDVSNIESARQKFYDGGSVLYFNGVWEADTLRDSPLSCDFAYAAYPAFDGKTLSYASLSSGYVLAKQDNKKKEEAEIRFLKYMLSDAVQGRIAMETGQAPCNPNIDKTLLDERLPLFLQALNTAEQADIKLQMIYSVWTEEQIARIQNMIEKGTSHENE